MTKSLILSVEPQFLVALKNRWFFDSFWQKSRFYILKKTSSVPWLLGRDFRRRRRGGGGAVLQELSETCCPITLSCFDAHHINEPNFKMTFCLVKKDLQMLEWWYRSDWCFENCTQDSLQLHICLIVKTYSLQLPYFL